MDNNYNEIRSLLESWYAGTATPADTHRLEALFAEATELPEDLAEERDLFRAIAEAEAAPVVMPEEYAARLDNALEQEMSRTRTLSRRRVWRIAIASLSSAAACLLIVFAAWHISFDTETETGPQKIAVSAPVKPTPVEAEETPTVAEREPAAEPVATERREVAKVTPKVAATQQLAEPTDLRDAEEKRLAANYRVVGEEDATGIINGIFCRLENRMDEQANHIGTLYENYDMAVTSLEY
jgi:hypothetical protein